MSVLYIILSVPVEIVENLMNVTHFAGGSVSLNFSASGFPPAEFAWYKNSQQLVEDETVTIINTTKLETPDIIITQSTLHFTNLNQSDEADYHCEARNLGALDTDFVAISHMVHLSVQCEH